MWTLEATDTGADSLFTHIFDNTDVGSTSSVTSEQKAPMKQKVLPLLKKLLENHRYNIVHVGFR